MFTERFGVSVIAFAQPFTFKIDTPKMDWSNKHEHLLPFFHSEID